MLEKYKKKIEKEINKEIDKRVNEIVAEIMKNYNGDIKEKKKIEKILKVFFKGVYEKAREEVKKIFWELIVKGEVIIHR